MAVGADYSHARPTRAELNAPGITFCCRYILDAARDGGKRLTPVEAQTLTGWGRTLVANFEYSAGGVLLGYNQGVADARVADAEMRLLGAPPGRPVYFSADQDLSISQIPTVLRYADGAAAVLGRDRVGLYGEFDLIEAAAAHGIKWLWQTYAWSRGLWSAHATIRQTHNGAFGSWDGDLDESMTADFGQWDTTGMVGADVALKDETITWDAMPFRDSTWPKPSASASAAAILGNTLSRVATVQHDLADVKTVLAQLQTAVGQLGQVTLPPDAVDKVANAVAAAVVAHHDALTDTDLPVLVAAAKAALREGAGAS